MNKTRVLLAKPGLDGHDRGAKVIARGMRDAGIEVVYTGLRQTPERIALAAIDEDVHVVCLSILSGAHVSVCRSLHELLTAMGRDDIPVVVGGIIPHEDIKMLSNLGVRAVFGPGSSLTDINRVVLDLARANQ
jgi:methylmalonyl-CoA mutase C-terminal domain/subunit